MRYDVAGNLIERRTATTALPAQNGAPATEPLLDATGTPIASIVERWAYDPDTGGETCHADAEGRVTTTRYVLGLTVERREYATAADLATLPPDATCETFATSARIAANDRVTTFAYCQIAGGACPGGAVRGDLVETSDGPRLAATGSHGVRRTSVTKYDAYGYAEETWIDLGGGAGIETTALHDPRGRVYSETDALGHDLARHFDGLDRLEWSHRKNRRGPSPGEFRSFTYQPGGQLASELLGTPDNPDAVRSRTIVLDGLNLPETVTEELVAGNQRETLVTITHHDAAGNAYETIDRRGVRKLTQLDALDRPQTIQVFVDSESQAAFATAGGDLTGFIQGKVVASFSYDAAGNKLSETDLHGHRTEFRLDPLYRVVGVVAPPVPKGFGGSGDGTVQYETWRRFDLAGNKLSETDGNGNTTTWTYDFANRVVETVDPVGRFERRAYDGLGEVEKLTRGVRNDTSGNEVVHFTSDSKGYDALGRSRGVAETFADLVGVTAFATDTTYDDVAHAVTQWDRRGAVTRRTLDDLDRVYEETFDVTAGRRGEVGA